MTNNQLKLAIPLSALLLLSSCRIENDLVQQQHEEMKIEKFKIFAERNAKTTEDYARIFAELATNYDRINKQDFTGMKSSAKAMTVSKASRRENLDVEYIDFSISSQLVELEGGKWIVYPKVKKGKVIALVIAYVDAEEIRVGYREMGETTDFYHHFAGEFQKAFDEKKSKSKAGKRAESAEDEPHCINKRTGEYIPFDDWRCQAVLERDYTNNIEGITFRVVRETSNIYLDFSWFRNYNFWDGCNFSNGIDDQCAMYADCYNNGGGHYEEPPKNPCEKAKSADEVISNNVVKQRMDKVLRAKLGSTNEWTVSIGQNADGSYSVSKELEGQPTSGNVPDVPSGNYVGDGHIHSGSGVPSPGDFYGMLKIMKDNIHYQVRFVYGRLYGNEEVYALVITDRNLAMQFLANYPMEQHFDYNKHTFRQGSPIFKDYNRIWEIGYNGYYNMSDVYGDRAIAMSYVLDKYNTGIALVKQNKNGNFESFKVDETSYIDKLAGNKEKKGATITNPCP